MLPWGTASVYLTPGSRGRDGPWADSGRQPARWRYSRAFRQLRASSFPIGLLIQNLRHTPGVDGDTERLGNTLERRVVEREDEVTISGKMLRAVTRMHGVHTLQAPNPRRVMNLVDTVWANATRGQRMTAKRLVVGRAEHVSEGVCELDQCNRLAGRALAYDANRRAIPIGRPVLKVVGKMQMMLASENHRTRCAD